MSAPKGPIEDLLQSLQERAKELQCLYHVHEHLRAPAASPDEVYRGVLAAIPAGYQHPSICQARLILLDAIFAPSGFQASPWLQRAPVTVEGRQAGWLEVYYTEPRPDADEGPFLKEERRLIETIADDLARYLEAQRAARSQPAAPASASKNPEWRVIVDFLRIADRSLLMRLARKIVNHLCWSGVPEAQVLLRRFLPSAGREVELLDENQPLAKSSPGVMEGFTEEAFRLVASHLGEAEIIAILQKWIKDDKVTFLLEVLESPSTTTPDLADALQRYRDMAFDEGTLSRPTQAALRASLMRRLFTDEIEAVNRAKDCIAIEAFCEVSQRVISPPRGRGRLGGKSAGLFLGYHVLRQAQEYADMLTGIRTPRTWYMASDGLLQFIHHNQLEDVYDRKYLELGQVRREYPHLIQLFKRSHFPAELLKGFSMALDDLENRPLIVRSSSLLEDRAGAAFSGKYKSLFLANQGSKRQRLAALTDAVAEVYASIFSPDAIEYRAERNLLDMQEEMGVMIQEVVGSRAGDYFLPSYAGVAFSNNEFRWSPRIRREDGLIRLVPGLGTRAVDRVGDDFPVLLAPGQPGLRVNASVEEVLRYAPRMADVINMRSGALQTIEVSRLLRECGSALPGADDLVSLVEEDSLKRSGGNVDFSSADCVVTFDGLINRTPFVVRMRGLLQVLRQRLGGPVDVEFASNGRDLYLLQCRPQSYGPDSAPAEIPSDIPKERVVFTASRYVSNGRADLTNVVYVDPARYRSLPEAEMLHEVGRIVGRLNRLLPKRGFLLIGPGRWGSRGDIKLGVPVTYSDINNSAALIEVARREGGYQPDLSFGTHFFQDMVEAGIRYLPLYPDDGGGIFNEAFLLGAPNILPGLLPDRKEYAETVRVIDVPAAAEGRILRLLMNGDKERAVAYLCERGEGSRG